MRGKNRRNEENARGVLHIYRGVFREMKLEFMANAGFADGEFFNRKIPHNCKGFHDLRG